MEGNKGEEITKQHTSKYKFQCNRFSTPAEESSNPPPHAASTAKEMTKNVIIYVNTYLKRREVRWED